MTSTFFYTLVEGRGEVNFSSPGRGYLTPMIYVCDNDHCTKSSVDQVQEVDQVQSTKSVCPAETGCPTYEGVIVSVVLTLLIFRAGGRLFEMSMNMFSM